MMIIVIAAVLAISNVQDENLNRDLSEGVLQGVSELGILTTEYLLRREDSTERAWNTKYNAIAKILVRADKNQTEFTRLDFIFIADAFLQVTRNYKRTLTLRSRYAPQEEIDSTILLERNMVSELLTRQQSIITEASGLSDQATSDARSSLEFAVKTVVLLLILLAFVIMSTSILVVRSIAKPLEELTKGTEIIGGGDLAYRTGITTRDEIGSLSRAFDQMTERLSTTTVSRDELADEVERRQRAETQLRGLFTELENKNTELERFMTLGQRLLVMNAGVVEQIGTPLEIYDRPETVFVAGFIGSPAMNFLDARIGAGGATVELPGGESLALTDGGFSSQAERSVTLGLRPEHLELAAGAPGAKALNVGVVEELGADTLIHGQFGTGGAELTVRLPGARNIKPGEVLELTIDAGHLHLFDAENGSRLKS